MNYQKNHTTGQAMKPAENLQHQGWIILPEDQKQWIQITTVTYKKLKVWKVKLENSKQFTLYKCGNDWMQHNEDNLEPQLLQTIGSYIDDTFKK